MSAYDLSQIKVVALSGGVGGAKLALGLSQIVPAGRLLIITNPGDDFDHYGLRICPDTDTVFYNFAGLSDQQRGWGRSDESWEFLAALGGLGGDTWFQLGDRDLALHVLRTHRLNSGDDLSLIMADLCAEAGIGHAILPATDDPLRTIVQTPGGPLPFQEYFVRERCEPAVTGFIFQGAEEARPAPGIIEVLEQNGLEAIIFCPSNPYVSLDPILAVPGIRNAINNSPAPKIGVSPIVGGQTIKGPAAKMMGELGVKASSMSFAEHYRDILNGLVIDLIDQSDADQIDKSGIRACVTGTVMKNLDDKIALAEAVLAFAIEIRGAADG